jgi:hypothetical protein
LLAQQEFRGIPPFRRAPLGMTPVAEQSDELISFLESPGSYPHRPAEVRVFQTHISWVFIASPFVFKVKKPVNLGFLDFSTLDKRRYFCQREVDLNRRLCPEIYLDVLPIYKTASGFSFERPGEIAEYSVKMRELSHGWFLSELLAKDQVGEKELDRVISLLRHFYESEIPTAEIEQWGAPEKLRISTDENFAQVTQFVNKTISPTAFEAIRHYTNQFFRVHENLFHERIQQHRILDCHGDLRLDHVHLTSEATTIFDCIEFNDRFRFIDIANDLAFLAMDFDFSGRRDLGNLLLRIAARVFGDDGLLKIADFYKCYRAFVRGKVESIQSIEPERENSEERAKQAAHYFHLALRYAVAGSQPLVVAVMGRVASGKTTVARQLGRELEWPVLSSDEIRKTLAALPLTQRTPPSRRAELYSHPMTKRTYRKLVEDGLAALDKYRGVILDATFSSRSLRRFLRDECRKADVQLRAVELGVDPTMIRARLQNREQSSTEISDARLEDFEKLTAAYESPSDLAPDLVQVSANNSVSETVKAVLFKLAEKQVG